MTRIRSALLPTLLPALWLGAGATAGTATDSVLQPFAASYEVVYRGLDAGTARFELERDSEGRYTYASRSRARGLFRLLVGNDVLQTSTFRLTPQGVQPLHYRGDDGSSSTARDISYDFDWQARRVGGIEEDQPVDVELTEGIQDPMSVQIALMYDLLRGRQPAPYSLVDRNGLKTYAYTHEGTARLDSPLGELDTVIYTSQRQGAKRKNRIWLAPSLGFMPVQAEQTREDRRDWLMRITSLESPPR